MKEADLLPTSATATKKSSFFPSAADTAFFGRGRYKFYALAAILLLAFWSMFTGTVTLKSSSGAGTDTDAPIHPDLDILEMEEREKVVRQMWDVYAHSSRIRLPRFWQEAFEAAYEELAGDADPVREAAISEIARMSMQKLLDLEPPDRRSKNSAGEKNHHVGGGSTKLTEFPTADFLSRFQGTCKYISCGFKGSPLWTQRFYIQGRRHQSPFHNALNVWSQESDGYP